MTSKNKMIDPADVRALLEAYDGSDQSYSDRKDLINGLHDLLPKPDYPANMFGMWAKHPAYGDVLITVDEPDEDGYVWFAFLERGKRGQFTSASRIERLTFPEPHPEYLTTMEDYEGAPEGTIVEYTDNMPYMKQSHFWEGVHDRMRPGALDGTSARVLRWGWGQ